MGQDLRVRIVTDPKEIESFDEELAQQHSVTRSRKPNIVGNLALLRSAAVEFLNLTTTQTDLTPNDANPSQLTLPWAWLFSAPNHDSKQNALFRGHHSRLA